MNILPEWNKPGSFSAGRDPLGLQAASVRLYTTLVPGLTNVTNRLRYYSFYCWVIHKYEMLHHSTDAERWQKFIRRAEAIYALSSVIVDDNKANGLAGTYWARQHKELKRDESFDFRLWTDSPGKDGQYLKAVRGNFGQFYISSMLDVGMLQYQSLNVPLLSEDYGLDLAKSFEAACPAACELMLGAIENGVITLEDCTIIGEQAHPSLILRGTDEYRLLVEFVLGKREQDKTADNRRATLRNALSALHAGLGWDSDAIRGSFYSHDYENAEQSNETKNLKLWQAYQANELSHIAMELLLNDILHEVNIHRPGLSPDDILNRVFGRAYPDQDLKQMSAEQFAKTEKFDALNEDLDVGMQIIQTLKIPEIRPPANLVREAIQLILTLWQRWVGNDTVRSALDPSDNFNRTVVAINNQFDKLSSINAHDALNKVLRRFIISNHMLIAGQKLASSGTFTYRFIIDDGRLEDTRLTEYGFTNPRLYNLLWFAEDVGLIEDEKLTQFGKDFISAI